MTPAPGGRVLRFAGDRLSFALQWSDGSGLPKGWRALLRTNIGRGAALRKEIIHAHTGGLDPASNSWHDIPLEPAGTLWHREIALTETGYFKAKAYAVDPRGVQHWPEGPDFGVSVHPDAYRSANTIYCAFVRMFGATRTAKSTERPTVEAQLKKLDAQGYTVIPPSGKFRDVITQLPHIIDRLGCRILHLLPVNPTPTTFARFGRFGSPYAVQDLTAVDPALVDFDKRTTGVEQFCELTYETHLRGGRVFLDVVANHTGWGSTLWERHPEWFVKDERGTFVSPGAWGVTWEDLVELDHSNPALWEELADVFLTWCRRGVDGFRCDAGYKIPVPAWRYITARVLDEFPQTIFLLEGLGGSWKATEDLLTEGGMQWAYSELFQNYSARDVATYADYSLRQGERVGLYVHYSETHDNDRLARLGRTWSLLRNRLCGLASVNGGFGFTCGAEWLAAEKLQVHESRGLSWGSDANIVEELARLNRLVSDHPCFLDGATLLRLSEDESPVFALSRTSAEGLDRALVLVNTDPKSAHEFVLSGATYKEIGEPEHDLVTGDKIWVRRVGETAVFSLPPGVCQCLAAGEQPAGLHGAAYRAARAQAAWAIAALSKVVAAEAIGSYQWRKLAQRVETSPRNFLSATSYLDEGAAAGDLIEALENTLAEVRYAPVVTWSLADAKKVTVVPPRHWLLLEDTVRFRATLELNGRAEHVESIEAGKLHYAFFGPELRPGDGVLRVERFWSEQQRTEGTVRVMGTAPVVKLDGVPAALFQRQTTSQGSPSVLLTNGRGGMARMRIDLGRIDSKYDCALAANLHPAVPVDRHVFAKRVRAWVVANGFISPLNESSLISFTPGPPAEWRFVASAGDGRAVEVRLLADMIEGENTTVFRFVRPRGMPAVGADLPEESHVRLTVRVDIEDRNFHWETQRNGGSEQHFVAHTHALTDGVGFVFTPVPERQLRVEADRGAYHHEAEWSVGIRHAVEASRGQTGEGDAYSPGWFELPLEKDSSVTLRLSAERGVPNAQSFRSDRYERNETAIQRANAGTEDGFGRQLAIAIQAFVARRDKGKTIIAGYPWFLDWGRDSLISARGMLAAGMVEEVTELLLTFGKFEQGGTLPNVVHGEDASNRDTSDAPLWYGIVCEELAVVAGAELYSRAVDAQGRTVADVLRSIASGYLKGTQNGIRVDAESALVWSPSHFTWMDTNHPAGTPREGYPVEIQALWIRLLRQLAGLNLPRAEESWETLAERASSSFDSLFWMEERGYPADLLIAQKGGSASSAVRDNSLRSNFLFGISLGLLTGTRAQRAVNAAVRHLVVPGALRTLAPLPVHPPLPIFGNDGTLLNKPEEPYAGRYEGDEDTWRKAAYHNGTAWTWTFPVFCEALAQAWSFEPAAVNAARAYLGSMDRLLMEGCVGHLPEIVDGDVPHRQRGCDAQAWGVTEALRVWKLLQGK